MGHPAKADAMFLHPTFTHFSAPKPTWDTPRRQMRCSCIPLLHTFPHQNPLPTPREGRCDVPASHFYTLFHTKTTIPHFREGMCNAPASHFYTLFHTKTNFPHPAKADAMFLHPAFTHFSKSKPTFPHFRGGQCNAPASHFCILFH